MLESPGQRDLASFYARNATLGSTDRYRTATLAEAYFLGRQYEGLRDWNDRSVPLAKRRPSILVPLFADVVNALDGFVWGGTRFPKAVVQPTRDPSEPEDPREIGPRLDPEQAKQLTAFVAAMVRHGHLDRGIREATRKALVTTSAAVILGARGGYLTTHVEPGKHCTPTFDPICPRRVASLEIVYQTEKEVPTFGGGVRSQWFWYRRTIDATSDTVYVEVPVRPGVPPQWTVDAEKSVEHGLGFCPVVWVRTLPDSSDALDGRPVIDPQLYPLLDAVNRTISQRDRAVKYVTDPQPVMTGVDDPDAVADVDKHPGVTWKLPAGVAFQYAEPSGVGAQVAAEHLNDLAHRFYSACRVVMANPEKFSGDVSGRFLELLHAPMVSIAGDLRGDLGDDAYCDLLALGLRLVAALVARGEDVWIPGAAAAADVLAAAQLAGPWLDVPLTLTWPKFFPDAPADEGSRLQSIIAAEGASLITRATATREAAALFPSIEDPAVEAAAVAEERDARQQQAVAIMAKAKLPPFGAKPAAEADDPAAGNTTTGDAATDEQP